MLNLNKKIFGLLLILATSTIYGNNESLKNKSLLNKWFCAFSTSKPMNLLENKIFRKGANLLVPRIFGDELAEQEYQDLGIQAQFALGIPKENHVPIKKIPKSLSSMPMGGFTVSSAIYVNEERLNPMTYGTKRSLLFHEAVHVKYKDFTYYLTSDLVGSVGSGLLAHKLLRYLKNDLSGWIHYPLVLVAVCGGAHLALSCHQHYMERRADIEGHYATRCPACVQEAAKRRRQIFEVEKHVMRNDGYLSAAVLETIAKDLESENILCPHHILEIIS